MRSTSTGILPLRMRSFEGKMKDTKKVNINIFKASKLVAEKL